jgi:hypothetical protein
MSGVHTNEKAAAPWGSIAALLAACFATVVGLVRGIDPEVILWRAIVAATLVGALTAVACRVALCVRGRASEK